MLATACNLFDGVGRIDYRGVGDAFAGRIDKKLIRLSLSILFCKFRVQ